MKENGLFTRKNKPKTHKNLKRKKNINKRTCGLKYLFFAKFSYICYEKRLAVLPQYEKLTNEI